MIIEVKNDFYSITSSSIEAKMSCHRILPGLFLGDLDAATNHEVLEYWRIAHVLSICEEIPRKFRRKGVTYKHVIIDDTPYADIRCHFYALPKWIEKVRENKENQILVHCLMGVSRSPTIVAALLMWRSPTELTFKQALNEVKLYRSIIDPNPGFIRQLSEFQANLEKYRKNRIKRLHKKMVWSVLRAEKVVSLVMLYVAPEIESDSQSSVG